MLEEQIKTSNEENIRRNIKISSRYNRTIHLIVIISKIIIIISGLLSFASTKFPDLWILSFLSGSLNFLATSLLAYSNFLISERKKIMKNLNYKLEKLGIKTKLLISESEHPDSDHSV